jgi:hypothetical protein
MALLRTQIVRKVQNQAGSAIANANATIYSLPDNSLATVYTNETGTATYTQPLQSGLDGSFAGWLELGDYSITIASSSGTSTSRYYANHPQQSYLETYSDDVPLTVKAGTALTSNMAEWKNASGSTVMSVSTAGSITSPTVTAIQGSVTNTQGSVNSTQGSVANIAGTAGTAYNLTSTYGSVSSHVSATTSVHGITNTANLVYTDNATLGSVGSIAGSVTAINSSLGSVAGTVSMGGLVFANEAARDAAITSPTEGMRAYLTSPTVPAATGETTLLPTGVQTIYNGSVWVCTTPISTYSATSALRPFSGDTTTYAVPTGGTNLSVTLVTGTTALITITANADPAGNGSGAIACAVSGASSIAASNNFASFVWYTGYDWTATSTTLVMYGLTAGTNTFTMQYRADQNGNTFRTLKRWLTVQGIA